MIARIKRLYRRMTSTPYLKQKDKVSYWFDQALKGSSTQLVQIGSNDGKTGDPLFPLLQKYQSWKALFVEPVPYLYKRLSENYTASRFTLENVAIGEAGNMNFYWVDPKAKDHLPDLPYWYDQLGSFDRNHIVKHLDGVLEPYILSAEISCITLDTLLDRNTISDIGILHIDTEGMYNLKI